MVGEVREVVSQEERTVVEVSLEVGEVAQEVGEEVSL